MIFQKKKFDFKKIVLFLQFAKKNLKKFEQIQKNLKNILTENSKFDLIRRQNNSIPSIRKIFNSNDSKVLF